MRPEDFPILSDLYDVIEDAYQHYDREENPLYPQELLQEVLLGLHSMRRGAESKFFNGHTNITSVAAAYDLWYSLREEVLWTYKDDLPQRLPLSQQKEFKQIKNLVIEEAMRLGRVHRNLRSNGRPGDDTGGHRSGEPG